MIGDASGSMEVAIRTSSIIAGLLTALTSAQLVFFNTENRYAPYLPKTIEEVGVKMTLITINIGTPYTVTVLTFGQVNFHFL